MNEKTRQLVAAFKAEAIYHCQKNIGSVIPVAGSVFLSRMLKPRFSETLIDLKKLSRLAKETEKVASDEGGDAAEKIVYTAVVHAGWILNECTVVLEALMKDPKKAYNYAIKMKRRYKVPD